MDRERKDFEDDITHIKRHTFEDLRAKDKEIEASKKAQTLAKQRLKQAEDTINAFLENPIADPTIDSVKDIQI